ncbi:MAG: DUF1540 domain-containing protein [Mycobacterium leprae]
MPNQEIYCTVNSCFYYGTGNHCEASKIMVKNNAANMQNTRMEIGSIGGEAQNSNQTLCETFVPKQQGPKPGIDRINRTNA